LRAFWEGITTGFTWFEWANMPKGDAAWKLLNQLYAGFALVAGAPDSSRHDIHRPGSILPATQMPPASTTQADSGPRSKRHVGIAASATVVNDRTNLHFCALPNI
jgi:hypothetical protein